MLKPQLHKSEEVLPKLKERQRQKVQNNKGTATIEGCVVRVRKGNKWEPATVTQILPSPRSYMVETEHGECRRNRRHLLRTDASPTPEVTIDDGISESGAEPTPITAFFFLDCACRFSKADVGF